MAWCAKRSLRFSERPARVCWRGWLIGVVGMVGVFADRLWGRRLGFDVMVRALLEEGSTHRPISYFPSPRFPAARVAKGSRGAADGCCVILG